MLLRHKLLRGVSVCALLAATSCQKPGPAGSLIGTWVREDDQASRQVIVEFAGGDLVRFFLVHGVYEGSYSIASGVVQITDTYCGWRMPAKYRYRFQSGKLVLQNIDDTKCARKVFLPGIWIRTPPPDPSQAAKTIRMPSQRETIHNFNADSLLGDSARSRNGAQP